MHDNLNKTVVIGLSGGVDSSVAALLLKQAGYNVIGITMNLWDNNNSNLQSIEDAKEIAKKLEIPFHIIDLKNEFKKYVIDYFANEYTKGRTPNPCIKCNKHLKFGLMLDKAKELFNAEYIATGHYAKVEFNPSTGRYYLKNCSSLDKDQTYALYSLSQEQLAHTLMPLGDYSKEDIRKIAADNNLITANKKDSQEICFVENNDYANFIKKNYNYSPIIGDFIDTKGTKYGKHKGIIHYTVGQRRGLGLSLKSPLYVKKLEPKTNEVILCPKEELVDDFLICNDVNLMSIATLNSPLTATVKIRYSAPKVKSTLIPMDNGTIKVVFDTPQRAVTPGQAVVFYDNDIVIGGGTII